MGFRFFRRIKIAPGVSINFSKSGASLSMGPRGAKVTVGGSRGTRITGGIPGTGLYYTDTLGKKKSRRRSSKTAQPADFEPDPPAPYIPPEARLKMGFFRRLITPAGEEAFVDGMREMNRGNDHGAYEYFRKATHLADGAFLAGVTAAKLDKPADAATNLKIAAAEQEKLGKYFDKYGISPVVSMQITPQIATVVEPNLRGALLTLVEVYQHLGEVKPAVDCLTRLLRLHPGDVLCKLSFCELLYDRFPNDQESCKSIVHAAEGVENDTEVHGAVLLYKAKALNSLGLHIAARDLLSRTIRKKKGRPEELLLALRYERAATYEALGHNRRAQSDLERIYAASPDYEDVAERLGL